VEELRAQILEGGVVVLALQRVLALPRQAILARLHLVIGHLDQLDAGAGSFTLAGRQEGTRGPARAFLWSEGSRLAGVLRSDLDERPGF
jgi:hypothetical protein